MSAYPSGNPASMKRRVLARVIDGSITGVLMVFFYGSAIAAILSGGGGELTVVLMGVLVLWSCFSLWSTFARAALPGQLMLGLHHVDSDTGRRAGGRTFLKYVIQSLTFGLAVLITPLSIQAPNRSWFDRLAGVTLIDAHGAELDPATGHQVAAPPTGWHGDESQLTQMGLGLPDGSAGPGMIQSVPFEVAGSQVGSALPAVRREAGVVEPRPAVSAQVVPPPSAPAQPRTLEPVVVLDTGETIALSGSLILGRAPRQSASLGQAALVVVIDQSVSANHLALGLDQGAPWVMDLSSTNGSWVEQDGRGPVRLEPMSKLALSPGAVIRLGQRRVTVTAR